MLADSHAGSEIGEIARLDCGISPLFSYYGAADFAFRTIVLIEG